MRLTTNTVQSDGLHILHPAIATSEQCLLSIEIETGQGPLSLSGKVMWYDRTTEEAALPFQMGIQFIEMSPEVAQRVRDLLKQSGKQSGAR